MGPERSLERSPGRDSSPQPALFGRQARLRARGRAPASRSSREPPRYDSFSDFRPAGDAGQATGSTRGTRRDKRSENVAEWTLPGAENRAQLKVCRHIGFTVIRYNQGFRNPGTKIYPDT